MPRPQFFKCTTHPYHVTCRSNNKQFFPIPLKDVWVIMLNGLRREIHEQSLAVHAFVMMSNHFHLLCHTPNGNLDVIMQRFLRSTSIKINMRNKSINHLWGGRYKWSVIENQTHYFQVYRYIYQNPLRANICDRVENYPYSTLQENSIPLHSFIPMTFAGNEGERLWLNERYLAEDAEIIKTGLRKSFFDVGQKKLQALNKLTIPTSER